MKKMSKTYTAQEFEGEFYSAMANWAVHKKVDPDPRGEWECSISHISCRASNSKACIPRFINGNEYRWKSAKKRTVPIGGVELVAPEVDAPKVGTAIFVELGRGIVQEWDWTLDSAGREALANLKVFLTREDCQAMADAQREQRLGEVKCKRLDAMEAINAELLEALQALLNDVGKDSSMLGAVKARAAIAKATQGELK